MHVGPIVEHSSDGNSKHRQFMIQDYKSEEGQRLKVE